MLKIKPMLLRKIKNFLIHKRTVTTLKSLISIFLIVLLFFKIDWRLTWGVLKNAELVWLIFGSLTFFSGVYFSLLRWGVILERFKISFTQAQLFRLYWIGAFFSNFLPSTIGGDGYRYIELAKQNPTQKEYVLTSVLFDRIVGFFAFFVVNLVTFLLLPEVWSSNTVLLFEIFIVFIVFVLLTLFILRKRFTSLFLERDFGASFLKKTQLLLRTFLKLDDLSLFRRSLFYSILFVMSSSFGQYAYLLAFGAKVNFFYVIFAVTIINIVGAVPISLNAIGITEGLSVLLYSVVGVGPAVSLAVALVARVINVLLTALGGILIYL